MKKKKDFLVYCGSPGVGKTRLCAALVPWAMKSFNSFRYIKESDLLARIRAGIDQFKGDCHDTLKYLIDDPLVIIDDIGSDGHSDWREEMLFDAIDKRYNSMLPTIITSNLTVDEFKNTFKPRFCSRLFASDNIIIELKNGEDFRQISKIEGK